MNKPIHYINRYRLPQYHSIEELFGDVSQQMQAYYPVKWVELPTSGASPRSLLKNLCAVRPHKKNIYHITGDVNYMALGLGKRSVVTVHDVQSALKGSWLKQLIIKYLWFKWPARRAKWITVISEFSKMELEQLIPRQAHKIKVIPNPVNAHIQRDVQGRFNEKRPNILLIGTKINKNLEGSLKALKGLEVNLCIIGMMNFEQKALVKSLGLPCQNPKKLSYQEVIDCYKKADMLCFPSTYEGFGMPIIEAQAVGRPVLTSNLGAMKEVAGDAACLVNPHDVQDIRKGVLKIIQDESYRNQLVKAGLKNVKRFSLQKTVNAYRELYETMMR